MSTELDIMSQLNSVDLSKVETSFPILKPGILQFQIKEIGVVTPDESDKKPFVGIEYTLLQPWESQPLDGGAAKPIAAGYPIRERVYVNDWTDPKTNEVKNFGRVQLLKLREAIFGPIQPGQRLDFNEMRGQTVTLRIGFDPAPKNRKTGETYGPQNTVEAYVKAKR